MPGYDGTGPAGRGPKTGREEGYCSPVYTPGELKDTFSYKAHETAECMPGYKWPTDKEFAQQLYGQGRFSVLDIYLTNHLKNFACTVFGAACRQGAEVCIHGPLIDDDIIDTDTDVEGDVTGETGGLTTGNGAVGGPSTTGALIPETGVGIDRGGAIEVIQPTLGFSSPEAQTSARYNPSKLYSPFAVDHEYFGAEDQGICAGYQYMWVKPDSKGGIQTLCSNDMEVLKQRIINTYKNNFGVTVSYAPGGITDTSTDVLVYFAEVPPELKPYVTQHYLDEKTAWSAMQQSSQPDVQPQPSSPFANIAATLQDDTYGIPNWGFVAIIIAVVAGAGGYSLYRRGGKVGHSERKEE